MAMTVKKITKKLMPKHEKMESPKKEMMEEKLYKKAMARKTTKK